MGSGRAGPYGRLMPTRSPFRSRAYVRAALPSGLLALLAAVVLNAATMGVSGTRAGPSPPASLPSCRVADVPAVAVGYHQWADVLLDTTYSLGRGYVPPDLRVADIGGEPVRLRAFVLPDLVAMLDAAKQDGVSIAVTSGYRSYGDQANTFARLVRSHGAAYAALSAARPGHSEHQLGTTIDLEGGAEWLSARAWQFGFVLSYPPDRSPAWTCYKPEPWHYRYFGRQRAADIWSSGLSPREWLWQAGLVVGRSDGRPDGQALTQR